MSDFIWRKRCYKFHPLSLADKRTVTKKEKKKDKEKEKEKRKRKKKKKKDKEKAWKLML